MGHKLHPLHLRAVELMRDGLATAGEIATAGKISGDLVRNWAKRHNIQTRPLRAAKVKQLLHGGASEKATEDR